MADTLPNIRIEAGEWRNLYALSGAEIGTQLIIENTGVCDIKIAVQARQPEG